MAATRAAMAASAAPWSRIVVLPFSNDAVAAASLATLESGRRSVQRAVAGSSSITPARTTTPRRWAHTNAAAAAAATGCEPSCSYWSSSESSSSKRRQQQQHHGGFSASTSSVGGGGGWRQQPTTIAWQLERHSLQIRGLHTLSLRRQQRPPSTSASSTSVDDSSRRSTDSSSSSSSSSSSNVSSSSGGSTASKGADDDQPYRPPDTSSSSLVSDNPSKDKIPRNPSDVSMSEIKRLFTLARPEKRTLSIALGLLAVSSVVSLSVPFTLGRIIDLFTSSDASTLPVSVPVAAAILATFFGIGAAANTGRSILMRIAGQRIVKQLRVDAYNNTLKLDMARYDMMGTNVTPLGDASKAGHTAKALAPLLAEQEQERERTVTSDNLNSSQQQRLQRPESTSGAEQPSPTDLTKADPTSQEGTPDKGGNSLTRARSSFTNAMSLSNASETTPDIGVRGVGDIISRLGSDSSIVGESLTRELSEGLRALATVVVGVGMMVFISAKLTVVMLCIVPPSAIGAVFYGRYLKKLSRRTQKKVGEMIAVAEERLSSVRTVQAFNAVEPMETGRYAKKASDIFDLAKKEAYASGLFYGGAGFSGNITMLALLSYGGKLVSQGEITVGDLSSLMLYTAYVGGSLVGLTSFFSTIMKGLGAAARVFELLDAKPASVVLGQGVRLPADTPPRALTFRNVHFNYPSRPHAPILRGVDFTIERGRSVAIAGGSGSGKSTIVNLLERYYDPDSGELLFGSEDIRTYTPESWRDRVSIVPQDPALFSQTIAENIAYGKPDATMSEIREAARLANCSFIDDLPLGFDTPVGAKAAQLSGGQRQRLAIARALVRQPTILVLDEATSALDAQSEALVNNAVKRITSSRSLTTILVAHRLSTLKTADEIIFMQDGRVAERGTYEELAQEGTLFWSMVRSQMLGTAPAPASSAAVGVNDAEAEGITKKEEEEARRPA